MEVVSEYLKRNKQHLTSAVDSTFSTSKVVYSSSPQGSNLGPLLFLLYLNDLSRSSEVLNFVNFVDDTTVSCPIVILMHGMLASMKNFVKLVNGWGWIVSHSICLKKASIKIIWTWMGHENDTVVSKIYKVQYFRWSAFIIQMQQNKNDP